MAARSAVIAFDAIEHRFEAAIATFELGLMLRDTAKNDHAHAALTDATERFTAIGASTWSARASEAVATDQTSLTDARLTPRERQICELAADGLHNREIAQRLRATESGVEAHLSRSYRKLGIRTRSQLRLALWELSLATATT
jgi:DNA-binding NarL/FixJ family response regulator